MTDVGLIVEGTYPYRVGGVSTWTDALVRGLPERTFTVVHLYAGEPPVRPAFALPANVEAVVPVRLPDRLDEVDVGALVPRVPPTRCWHALATGYAGLLGAALRHERGRPLLLTEHGIYWHEIAQGGMELESGLRLLGQEVTGANPCADRSRWVERFRRYARTAYAAADRITTVCDGNRRMQLDAGADPARCTVIPNGVTLPEQRARLRRTGPPRVGLVGRVVSLKDVKTFVRACRRLQDVVPEARCYVVGPTDADPAYFRECRAMAGVLGVRGLRFTGHVDAHAWYPRLDVVALTSISEAQPLALLEAMAHGRPVVATDVGDCRSLVEGPADALGTAGLVVPPRDAGAVAEALAALVRDAAARERMGTAGRERVAASYRQVQVAARYGALYEELLHPAGPQPLARSTAPIEA